MLQDNSISEVQQISMFSTMKMNFQWYSIFILISRCNVINPFVTFIFDAEVKMIMNFARNIQNFQLHRYLNETGQNVFNGTVEPLYYEDTFTNSIKSLCFLEVYNENIFYEI